MQFLDLLVHFATSKETGIKGHYLGSIFFICRHYFINKLLIDFCGEDAYDPNVRVLCTGYLETLIRYHNSLHEQKTQSEEEENSEERGTKRKATSDEEEQGSERCTSRKKEEEQEKIVG